MREWGRSGYAAMFGSSVMIAACFLSVADDLAGGPIDAGAGGKDGDGGSTAEAGAPDSAKDGDAATVRGCASFTPPPTFCDDFDRTGLGAAWTKQDQGEELWTLDDAAVSPPSSLQQILPTVDASAPSFFQKSFTGSFSSVDFSVQLRLDELGAADMLTIIPVGFSIANVDYTLSLRFSATETEFLENAFSEATLTSNFFHPHPLHPAVPIGNAWTSIELHAELSPSRSCVVKIGGTIALETNLDPGWPKIIDPTLDIGHFAHIEPAPPARLHIDDVAIWLHP